MRNAKSPSDLVVFSTDKIPFHGCPTRNSTTSGEPLQLFYEKKIELPDIPSDSESDNASHFAVPNWAKGPQLLAALASERRNPEEIFGPVLPVNMEEIFPNQRSPPSVQSKTTFRKKRECQTKL